MAAPKAMSGARAKVGFIDSAGQPRYVGIYNNFSYGVVYDVQATFILGRYSAGSLDYTAMEPVNASGNAYRVIRNGPHTTGMVPRLKDLLTHPGVTIAVFDRLTKLRMAQINDVRPLGYNTALSARQLEEMALPYMGLLVDDEDGVNAEAADSLELPG